MELPLQKITIALFAHGHITAKQAASRLGFTVDEFLEELRRSRTAFLRLYSGVSSKPPAGPAVLEPLSLILLRRLGYVWLLKELFGGVLVPESVLRELYARDRDFFSFLEYLRKEDVAGEFAEKLSVILDEQLADAIHLSAAKGATLVVDSGPGITVAKELGLNAVTTLGLLLLAKRDGLLASVSPVLFRLESLGYIALPEARSALLEKAGETLEWSPPRIKA